MKARLITNGIFSLIATITYILLIIMLVRGSFSSSIFISIIMGVSILASVIMGIITLAMEKHESARGLTIASGVLGILAILYIPVVANWIVSFIGVYKINQAKKETIEEQEIAVATNQTSQLDNEENPFT